MLVTKWESIDGQHILRAYTLIAKDKLKNQDITEDFYIEQFYWRSCLIVIY